MRRIDGWCGDFSEMPDSIAREITMSSRPFTEVDRIRARMFARQMLYERRKKKRAALRKRFDLITR